MHIDLATRKSFFLFHVAGLLLDFRAPRSLFDRDSREDTTTMCLMFFFQEVSRRLLHCRAIENLLKHIKYSKMLMPNSKVM